MNQFNYVGASVEFFSAFIIAIILVGCIAERQYKKLTGKLFICILIIHILMLLVDVPIWILLKYPNSSKVTIIKILSFLSDSFFCILISLYSYCLTSFISQKKKISYKYAHFITIFCGIALLFWFVNIFNEMYIYYDETGLDQTGSLYNLSQIFNIVLFTLVMLLALKNHKTLGSHDTFVIVLYGAIPAISIPLQIFWAVTPVFIATTFSLMLVYTSIHAEQIRITANIKKKLIEKKLALSESNNMLLMSQIEPHFLCNALASIYYLCDINQNDAKAAISDLSRYLRGNLDSIRYSKLISFTEELNHLKAYLSLEKIRYADYLEVIYDINVTDFLIPPLTVQPLVENAVNHGISDLPKGGCIIISAIENEIEYEIRVKDNGIGFDPQNYINDGKSHIGISTVKNRLRIMCSGTLDIISIPNIGTTAVIRIPKTKR